MNFAPGPIASVSLDQSRAYCEQVTKTYARNFYYGLRLLPAPKRAAMYALYAWMRLVDDIADNEDGRTLAQRIEELQAWRTDTPTAPATGPPLAQTETQRVDGSENWSRR